MYLSLTIISQAIKVQVKVNIHILTCIKILYTVGLPIIELADYQIQYLAFFWLSESFFFFF